MKPMANTPDERNCFESHQHNSGQIIGNILVDMSGPTQQELRLVPVFGFPKNATGPVKPMAFSDWPTSIWMGPLEVSTLGEFLNAS